MLFLSPFEGFNTSDFGAYTQEKWSSNLYNRPRMKVRDKLSAVGLHIHEALTGAGYNLAYELGEFRPNVFNGRCVDSQWLFFTRPEDEKKKLFSVLDREKSIAENLSDPAHHKRHVVLGVKVHADGIDVMLGIHRNARIDVRNGASRLAQEWEQERLDALVAELGTSPAGELRLGMDGALIGELGWSQVQGELKALAGDEKDWFIVGRRFETTDPALSDTPFQEMLATLFIALMPLYTFLAWSSDNDWVALRETLKTEKAVVQKADAAELAPGSEVMVTAGLFSGKKGVVQEIDRKGMVKVSVGKMVVQVKGKALKVL